jgi:hypothetical protein
VTEGGQVYLQAAAVNAALASVLKSGSIDTTGVQGGQVHVLADGGHIRVDGSIKANSTGTDDKGQPLAGGDIYIGRDKDTNELAAVGDVRGATLESKGGFVETSGDHLKTDGVQVMAKEWLLDPSDITISAGADAGYAESGAVPTVSYTPASSSATSVVNVSTLQTAINAGTSVTIATTNDGTSGSGAGNITIADALSFNNTGPQSATLSLIADNGITQNAVITGTGTQLVNISMTANGNFQGNTAASANSRGITLNAGITTNGNITLTGNNQSGAANGAGAGVNVNSQTIDAGPTGDVTMTGTAINGSGVFLNDKPVIKGRDITLTGTANASTSGTGVRFNFSTNTPLIELTAVRDLNIRGTLNASGTATGSAVRAVSHCCPGTGGGISMTATNGQANITGIQTGNVNNTMSAVYLTGLKLNASGDISIQAQAANSNSLAIHMNREAGTLNNHPDGAQMRVRSTNGNVLIQSNQGAVLGQDAGAVLITGRNVTLDNTGAGMTASMSVGGVAKGNIDSSTGAIVLGDGTSTYLTSVSNWWGETWTPLGVSLRGASGLGNSTDGVTATGNLTIGGSSSATQGVVVGTAMTVGGNIHLASRTTAANTIGLNIGQALTAAGSIGLTGESTHITTPGVGLNLGAMVRTTGNNSTTTLTSTTGTVSGTGNITTAVGNTGSITVNAATAGALSGVISGGGSLVKQGAGTTSLTGNNSYTGITTISAGSLQIGNATTTGTLGSGAVTNNAVLTFSRSNAMTVGNAISGTGSLNQTGAGTTTLTANNSYVGTTTISGGTLQIGSGGPTGTLGVGDVTLSNGANLNFVRNTITSIDNNISGNGNVNANITGTDSNLAMNSSIALSGATGSQTNNAILSTTGSITQSAGSIAANNLFLTATNGSIATAGNRISSNVSNLAMVSAGDQFATQSSALRLAARTTGGGHIDVLTTQGTLTVDSVNGVNGVSASGSGTITLSGTSTTADGLVIAASRPVTSSTGNITLSGTATGANGTGLNIGFNGSISTGGNVSLTGNTAANNRTAGTFAAVTNAGTVSGSNITLTALASNTTANVLGYYGAGGNLVATQNLTANAESRGDGVGFYMWDGTAQSGTGMSITGTGNTESAIGLDNGAEVLNKVIAGAASGNLVLTGSSNSTVSSSVGLYRAVIENAGTNGGVQISATKGDVRANYGQANTITNGGSGAVVLSAGPSLATDAGAINGTDLTITQNGNGGVQVLTSGTGNVTTPKIVNAGTGNVTVAAGTQLAAGNGTGGQIRTVSGNTITQTNAAPGKTYIYTGNASDTGVLSNLGAFGAALYLSTIGANTKNAASNRTYADGPITGGANAQVMFREKLAFTGVLNDATVTYGSTDSASLKTALQTANPSGGTPGTFTQISNSGNLQLLVVDVVADSTSTMTTAQGNAANLSSSGQLKASTSPYRMDLTGAQYNLAGITANALVNQRVLTGVTIAAAGNTYGSAVTPGALSFAGSNWITGDQIGGTVSVVSTAADLSSSGHLKFNANGYNQTVSALSSGNANNDANNYSFAGVTANGNYTVSRLALTGVTIAAAGNTYGSAVTPGALSFAGSNRITGDQIDGTVSVVSSAADLSSSGHLKFNANGYNQTISALSSGNANNDANNYSFAGVTANGNYTVSRLALTGVTIAAAGNTYGSAVTPGALSFAGSNRIVGDQIGGTVSVVSTAADLSSSGHLKFNANGYNQTVSALSSGNANNDANNYSFAGVTANGNYTVSRLTLTGVTIAAASNTYGSAVTPGALSFAGSNRITGDQIDGTVSVVSTAADLSSSGHLRAGNYMQTAGSTLSGLDQGNYIFAGVNSSTANYVVARRALSADIGGVTTPYGTPAATAQASISGQVAGDQVFVTGGTSLVGAVYSSSNRLRAGTYQQTADGVLGGADAGNYTTSATAAANYVVTPRVINASVTAADKVYDGNVAATLVATSADILLGDLVNVTGLTGSFASRNVVRDGTGNVLAQAVTVSGSAAALGGADGANYVLGNAASVPATTARITPRELSVSGITASDKVYDGNTTAVVSAVNAVLSNAVAGDSVAVSTQNAQGNFADKDVARGAAGQVLAKAVQVSGLQLQGADAGNYSLQTSGASAQASITPRPVSLSGNSAADKVADGTTTAQVTAGSLNGLVAGESLNVNAQGEFEDALVGTNKAVNARFALENGALGLASNYQLSNPVEVLRASIVAFVPGKVSPETIGGGSTSGSRVSFGGGAGTGAATGVNDEPVDPVMAQCSVLNPEKCMCVETPLPSVELCFVPVQRVSLKD